MAAPVGVGINGIVDRLRKKGLVTDGGRLSDQGQPLISAAQRWRRPR